MSSESEKPRSLVEKVREWLQQEGYPLEFRTAHAFRSAGFSAVQGRYVRQTEESPPRELDVVATLPRPTRLGGTNVQIAAVVECKWSRDKPWVAFTAPSTMAPSACVAQSVGSILGETLMHCVAASSSLHSLSLFSSRERNGFGGRRALVKEKDHDHFYSTVQSIVSKTAAYVGEFDDDRPRDTLPTFGRVAFPIVVIDADLFEAHYAPGLDDVTLNAVETVRLHWRGGDIPGQWISTVDVVRFDALGPYAAKMKTEMEQLWTEIQLVLPKLTKCYQDVSLEPLESTPVSRGYTGLPLLLDELYRMERRKATLPRVGNTEQNPPKK